MINDKGQICMNGEPIVVGPDGHLYLESFLKNQKTPKKEKIKFEDFIWMTQLEYEKLCTTYGEAMAKKLIQQVDRYISNTGRRYKDHYKMILNWAEKGGIRKIDPLKKTADNYDIGLTEAQKQENKAKVQDMKATLLSKLSQ